MLILTLVLMIIIALCAAVIAMMFKKLTGLREDLELSKRKPFEKQIRELHEIATLEANYMVQADRALKNILHAIAGALAPDKRIEIMFNDETEARPITLPAGMNSIPSPDSRQYSRELKQ